MKKLSLAIVIVLFFSTCAKKQDPFLIQKHNIGLLTDSTQVRQLDSIFINDSIVRFVGGDEFTGNINNIDIYDKDGNHLLVLTPTEALDSTAVIDNIRILDPRYKTAKNISNLSTFKDIQNAYKINRIDNLINSININVNEINAYFTIDKKELPANLRFDMKLTIEASQIPDDAKIKYFMLNWN
ncbi:MAG: hypothetical protein HKO81_02145 [Flavobacteriaceae bacterium]|nr:hypothetical protein [Flavobacteriaceae bacterium]